jgi:hypothetical protein
MSYYTLGNKRIVFNGQFLIGPNVYDDWFLPSRSELVYMHTNIANKGLGDMVFGSYWSSSEDNATEASRLSDGSGGGSLKSILFKNRAARVFTAPEGAYSISTNGPAGGWIFHIVGTTYYEGAPFDNIDSAWSNITNVLVGSTGINIGDGITNTAAILAQPGHINSAAKLCADLIIYN